MSVTIEYLWDPEPCTPSYRNLRPMASLKKLQLRDENEPIQLQIEAEKFLTKKSNDSMKFSKQPKRRKDATMKRTKFIITYENDQYKLQRYLNEQSARGWHAEKVGSYHITFSYNEDTRYYYH